MKSANVFARNNLTFKKASLLSPTTVLLIGFMACIADAITIYQTIDPLIKKEVVFTLLFTLTSTAVIDIGPAYFPEAIKKLEAKKLSGESGTSIKCFLVLTITMCALILVAIFTLRYVGWEFIFEQTVKINNSFSKIHAFTIVTFMNFVNLATSIFVFFLSYICSNNFKEEKQLKKFTLDYSLTEEIIEIQHEIGELDRIINYNYISEEQALLKAAARSAAEEADYQKIVAREALERFTHDEDVNIKITNDALAI